MRKLLPVHLFVLVIVIATSGIPAWSKSATHIGLFEKEFVHKFLKPGEYLHESDVKEGDVGYGLSVFQGTKIERFDVKVIGVMKQVLNGRDSILVRISGDVLGKNNVVRGMSGSPIFIRDKLVGALSYGFDFSKEPIVGVTPIVDMLDALIKPKDVGTLKKSKRISQPDLMISGNTKEARSLRQAALSELSVDLSGSALNMVPLMSPVALSGFTPKAKKFLAGRFKTLGLDVSQGSSGGLNKDMLKKAGFQANILQPGSAVSLLLSTGDFTSAASGTVTGTFGKRVLAFGHPLMEAGAIDVPMSSCYVHHILPSLSVSFKMSSPLKILGRIFADRPWSVGGEIGRYARMVPVNVTIIDGQRDIRREFHSKVINHADFTSDLIAAITMSAMESSFQSTEPYTVKLKSRIKIKNGRELAREDLYTSFASSSSGSSILKLLFFSDPVVSYVNSVVSKIYNNDFKKSELESVDLEVYYDVGKKTAEIERVIVENPVVEPGNTVNITCELKPYSKPKFTRSFKIKIPRDVPDGDFAVGVAGGSSFNSMRKSMKLFDPEPENFDEILERVLENPSADQLIALLALPNQAIQIDGKVIQSPPGHWSKLFFSDRYTAGPSIVVGEKKLVEDMDCHISGVHIVGFKVKRKKPYLKEDQWFLAKSVASQFKTGTHMTGQARKVIDTLGRLSGKKPTTKSSSSSSSTSPSSSKSKTSSTSSNFATDVKGIHTRSVKMWNQSTDTSFGGGEKVNCTVDSWGRIFPGFETGPKQVIKSDVRSWSSTFANGKLYFSTSDQVFSWDGSGGAPQKLAGFDALLIPCLASDSVGNVYAAIVPSGEVFVLKPDGSKKLFYKTRESIISAMAVDPSGNLYIGVAGTGKIYKVGREGALLDTYDTGQAHVTCLVYSKNAGKFLVGTGESGNVYSLSATGTLKSFYQTDQHIVTGLAFDKRDNLFVATAGSGQLLKVDKTGKVTSLATSDAFYHMYYDEGTDSIFTGDAEGDITQIQIEPLPDRAFFVPVKHTDQDAVVSLCGDQNSNLYALTSNLPTIEKIRLKPLTKAFYTSPVKDAERESVWSKMYLRGAYNQFSPEVIKHISVETRVGSIQKPDKSWSGWAKAVRGDDGYQIASGRGRYFQYRITWNLEGLAGESDKTFPMGHDSAIGRVMTTYLPTNNAPSVSSFNLTSGAYVSGKKDMKLTAYDPDGDDLVLAVEISDDNGKSWKLLQENLRGKKKDDSKKKSSKSKLKKAKDKLKKKDEKKSKDKGERKADKKEPEKNKDKSDSGKDKEKADFRKKDKGEASDAKEEEDKNADVEEDEDAGEENDSDSDSDSEAKAPSKDSSEKVKSSILSRLHFQRLQAGKKDSKKSVKAKILPSKKYSKKKDKSSKKSKKSKKPKVTTSTSTSKSGSIEWTWDTKKEKNGIYMLRFKLSDAPSNGGSGAQNQFYRTVIVDNKVPSIENVSQNWSGKTLHGLSLKAVDKHSPIVNAVFETDSGDTWAFIAKDGLVDCKSVELIAHDIKFKNKPKSIKIIITDQAGNQAKKTIKLK